MAYPESNEQFNREQGERLIKAVNDMAHPDIPDIPDIPEPEAEDVGKVLGVVEDGVIGAKYGLKTADSGVLFVKLQGDGDDVNFTIDKTFNEISAAISEGKLVYVGQYNPYMHIYEYYYTFCHYGDSILDFVCMYSRNYTEIDEYDPQIRQLTINSDNTVSIDVRYLVLAAEG